MTQEFRIGFIGFGEAGFHIAKGLRAAGAAPAMAYDIHSGTPGRGEIIQRRAAEAGVTLAASSAELAEDCDILLSVVTCDQASAAARQTVPHLASRHYYADLNSVSPAVKQSIAGIVAASPARFIEIAVMAPVPPYGHAVPMLAGGDAAEELSAMLAPFGMRIEVASREIGVAAAAKMFRSIVIKGMEALITECVLAAGRYGAAERVFRSLAETYPGIDWPAMADYSVGRVVVHGERRAREMEEVAETLRSLGLEPIMAEATARRMDWSAQLGLKARFGGEPPASYRDLVEAVSAGPGLTRE
jgi:3-hydroxyisobutyrate dehydrogenase-like beta-hydroxyacid dehydrogenase